MNKSRLRAIVVLANLTLLGGCTTTTGTGDGTLTSNSAKNKTVTPVVFTWKSTKQGQQGTMMATLPNAVYQGRFYQITHLLERGDLVPLWEGWNEGWVGWPYWGEAFTEGYDMADFVIQYSGKVVANLSKPDGGQMRCRFYLLDPKRGMSGGGQGECQLSGGRTINNASFASSFF